MAKCDESYSLRYFVAQNIGVSFTRIHGGTKPLTNLHQFCVGLFNINFFIISNNLTTR